MSADRAPGDFGTRLRAARERRGISLRQIANATKISVSVLEALERNDISRLPGGIFGRGFVRSYAVEVGLDPEATIQDFIATFPNDSVTAGHRTSDQIEDNQMLESERRTAGTFLSLLAISIPIAGVVLYMGVAGRRARETPVPLTVVAAAPAPKIAVDPPAPAAPQASVPAAVPAATQATTPPAPAAPLSAELAPLTIALSVKRPCWVSATVDGQKAIERLLQVGEQQTIRVRREMVLTAGDAAAISMTLNGATARPLGKTGEVVTARLTLNNFKEFLQTP
jgi:cytoskeleton protein RodZ